MNAPPTPDYIFYPMVVLFLLLFLPLIALVNRGMDRQTGPGCSTFWLILGIVGTAFACLLAAQFSGHTDVIGILAGG
jgi:hypothetical protein